MKYRKLRIAWSVAWGIAGVLLIVLWVRSYWWTDHVLRIAPAPPTASGQIQTRKFICISRNGSIALAIYTEAFPYKLPAQPKHGWVMGGGSSSGIPQASHVYQLPSTLGFTAAASQDGLAVITPDWFLLSLSVALSAAPWLAYCSFSLRTLFIVTTVAAIGLGWIVYALRK